MERIKHILKGRVVPFAAAAAAAVSAFFTPPSAAYLGYIDFRVLALLFCLMLVVAGFQKTGFFDALALRVTSGVKSARTLRLGLVLLTFFSSMLITNDVALIAFVPFSISVLALSEQNKNIISVVVLQTVAANLGSMLTPVGNPQNLYLFSFYNIGAAEFFKLMAPPVALALFLIVPLALFGGGGRLSARYGENIKVDRPRFFLYALCFFICLLAVFRVADYRAALAVTAAVFLFSDKGLFKKVDYGLLATFLFFFIFTGNISSLAPVRAFLGALTEKSGLFTSAAVSQVISNVPAAVLLSGFTENYRELLLGTNIGGLGTLVASLASLISYKLYAKSEGARPAVYLAVFTAVNLGLLALLLAAAAYYWA